MMLIVLWAAIGLVSRKMLHELEWPVLNLAVDPLWEVKAPKMLDSLFDGLEKVDSPLSLPLYTRLYQETPLT